jgi:SulP family sulfate permease
LALAVLIGVIISALVLLGRGAKRIRARKYIDDKGVKHYEIYGPLFLVLPLLLPKNLMCLMVEEVIVDLQRVKSTDMSPIDAIHKLTERYAKRIKRIHL